MSERIFRLIIGSAILLASFFQLNYALWGISAYLAFEGVTGLRATLLISRFRYGEQYMDKMAMHLGAELKTARINFAAERLLRIVVASIIFVTTYWFQELLWFVPYFVGIMLFAAGLSNICPMFLVFRWVGFK